MMMGRNNISIYLLHKHIHTQTVYQTHLHSAGQCKVTSPSTDMFLEGGRNPREPSKNLEL